MSCTAISKLLLANITPDSPPKVNKDKKPKTYNKGVFNTSLPPYNVANHENILIPVGIAIIIVAAVK